MRSLITVVVGLAFTAALWSGGPVPVLAEGHDDLPNNPLSMCEPGPAFVPGTSLGPVVIGMPLDAVPRWFGRPRSVENRRFLGHTWTHAVFTGLDVLARDNSVVAVNLPRLWPIPVRTNCDTYVARSFNLPVGYVQQTYGRPSTSYVLNGVQYWLYNALGLVLTLPVGSNYVQGLTVYPTGQYCTVAPVFVSFGGFAVNAGNATPCPGQNREGEGH